MADIGGDTRRAADIVEVETRDVRVELEEEREGLADASAGAKNGDLCLARRRRGELTGLRKGAGGRAGEHGGSRTGQRGHKWGRRGRGERMGREDGEAWDSEAGVIYVGEGRTQRPSSPIGSTPVHQVGGRVLSRRAPCLRHCPRPSRARRP